MFKYLFSLLVILLLPGYKPEEDRPLIGVKIYEHSGPYDQLFLKWNKMGVCLARFQAEKSVSIPDSLATVQGKAAWIMENHGDAWTAWRCQLITSMVEQLQWQPGRRNPIS